MQHEVMVSAVHPSLGRLYWVYESGADCNAPNYFGITSRRTSALLLPSGWRNHSHLSWKHHAHIYSVFSDDDQATEYSASEDDDSGELIQEMTGLLGSLQARSGQTVEEFRMWLLRASWCDTPWMEVVPAEPVVEDRQAACAGLG